MRKPLHTILVAHEHDERSVVLTENLTSDAVEDALRGAFGLQHDPRPIIGLRCAIPINSTAITEVSAPPSAVSTPVVTSRSWRARFQRLWSGFNPDAHVRNPTFPGIQSLLDSLDGAAMSRRSGLLKLVESTYTSIPIVGVVSRRSTLGELPDVSPEVELRDIRLLMEWFSVRGLETRTAWKRERWYHFSSFQVAYIALPRPAEFSDEWINNTCFLSTAVVGRSGDLARDVPEKDESGQPLVYELVFGKPATEPALSETVLKSINAEAQSLVQLLASGAAFVCRILFRVAALVGVVLIFGNVVSATALKNLFDHAYAFFVERPLHLLYRNGPYLEFQGLGIGFWEGKSDSEVCAAMTTTREAFWRESDRIDECTLLLRTRETAFLKTCEALFFLVLLVYVVRYIVIAEIEALVRPRRHPEIFNTPGRPSRR